MRISAWVVVAVVGAGCSRFESAPGLEGTIPAIVGTVELGALSGPRTVQATLGDVAVAASVSLIDTTSGATVKTALTDAGGNFALAFGPTFAPTSSALYFLEAVKGLGGHAVGRNAARVRTLIRWSGTAWQGLTAGTVKVGTATTALAAIYGLKQALPAGQRVSAASLIDALGSGGYTPVANASQAEYDQTKSLVAALLAGDLDPLASLGYNGATGAFYQKILAQLAPDDTGNPALHHDYVMTKSGVASTFVWIPVFTAYQLIVPGNCGGDNTTKPVGYWVATEPGSGTQDTDWAEERLGGFYAGKYEASRADAIAGDPTTGTGATAGSGSSLKVERYCVPWTGIDWDTAAQACLAYDAHAHLLRDDEWTALAVWATINGITVYGNNAETNNLASYTAPADIDSPDVTFVDDPTYSWAANGVDRSLTGSATSSLWSGNANLSTHSGTTAGVFDLNGNIWDQTETVGLAQTTGNYILNDITLPLAAPGENNISALATDPRLRRHGLPGATAGGTALFGFDFLWKSTATNMKCLRGGAFFMGDKSGLWAIYLDSGRSYSSISIGFRPALTY